MNKKKILVDMSATLIHHGHIRLLKKASKLGIVIVALTRDSEIKKYKNYSPELNFNQRKEILESIKLVNKVVPSNFIIKDNVLKKYKIDTLVQGDDHINEPSSNKLKLFERTRGISSSLLRKKSAKIHFLENKENLTWKKVWEQRIKNSNIKLSDLNLKNSMILNGHYDGAGKIPISSWKKYGKKLKQKFNIDSKQNLYEVGCGSGAFLYLFKDLKKIGGCDFSGNLIRYCRKFLPNHSKNILEKKSEEISISPKYDFVVSHGLLHYLSNISAKKTIIKMIKKSSNKIILLDIPEKKFKKKYLLLRKKALGETIYNNKYKNLNHNYYTKSFFSKIAKKEGCSYFFFKSDIEKHKQGKYRFNVCFSKK